MMTCSKCNKQYPKGFSFCTSCGCKLVENQGEIGENPAKFIYCRFCGRQIRNDSVFCFSCGRKQSTGNMADENYPIKTSIFNKKAKNIIALLLGFVALALTISIIAVLINSPGSPSIVGTWRSAGGDEISFDNKGRFTEGHYYETYTIYDDKKLSMIYQDWDKLGTSYSYDWGNEAKYDDDYWYISGNKLYYRKNEYTRK